MRLTVCYKHSAGTYLTLKPGFEQGDGRLQDDVQQEGRAAESGRGEA